MLLDLQQTFHEVEALVAVYKGTKKELLLIIRQQRKGVRNVFIFSTVESELICSRTRVSGQPEKATKCCVTNILTKR